MLGFLPVAPITISTGIGIHIGIAAAAGCKIHEVIMIAEGFLHFPPAMIRDPLAIPAPIFRFPRFAYPDHLLCQVEQMFEFGAIQFPPLVPESNASHVGSP